MYPLFFGLGQPGYRQSAGCRTGWAGASLTVPRERSPAGVHDPAARAGDSGTSIYAMTAVTAMRITGSQNSQW